MSGHRFVAAVCGVALAAAGFVGMAGSPAGAATTGAINGTVTASGGGAVSGLCVAALQQGVDPQPIKSVATALDGTYTLTSIPSGNVLVEFYSNGTNGFCGGAAVTNFVPQWWHNKPTAAQGDLVSVPSGGTHTGIDAVMVPAGTITGTVTDSGTASPVAGICVAVYSGLDLITATATAADGTYTLNGSPTGSVTVKFFSTGFCPGGSASNYITQWYNNKPLQGSADTVTVTAGGTTAGINAAMAAGGSISGTVTQAAGGAGLGGICVLAYSSPADVLVASTGTDIAAATRGNYRLDGVPAGNVRVEFISNAGCPGGVVSDYVTQWYSGKSSFATAADVAVAAGATTPNINAALVAHTSFTIAVNGGPTASIGQGTHATLSESGLPALATGTVTFHSSGQPNLCTITLPATSCQTSTSLPVGSYTPITATYTSGDTNFVGSSSTNSVTLTVATNPTSFTIAVNGGSAATVVRGNQATLSESGLPAAATGTVTFHSSGQPNLCTITLPATSCLTSAGLADGVYSPITAAFHDTDGNYIDSSSANSGSLTVQSAPASPGSVHATLKSGTVTVSWSAPFDGGLPITRYGVTASPGGRWTSVPGSSTQASFKGLAAGTYRFVVHATNAIGAGPDSSPSNAVAIVQITKVGRAGYWMLGAGGHVYGFGNAAQLGSARGSSVALAARRDGTGYWVVDSRGNVSHFGSAKTYGHRPALRSGEVVTAISSTPKGLGYWLFTNQGRALPYGDAHWYGDMGAHPLNGGVIASAATPSGHGYYMVGSDGGVFTFGDARFHGSTGAMHVASPVVAIAPTLDGRGYWLVASDGELFAFNAPFRGSMGKTRLSRPINGLVAFGNGYLMVASDGGIFNFSNKPFFGSLGGHPPAAPIVGVAAFVAVS